MKSIGIGAPAVLLEMLRAGRVTDVRGDGVEKRGSTALRTGGAEIGRDPLVESRSQGDAP